jgi:hypothetical protein
MLATVVWTSAGIAAMNVQLWFLFRLSCCPSGQACWLVIAVYSVPVVSLNLDLLKATCSGGALHTTKEGPMPYNTK